MDESKEKQVYAFIDSQNLNMGVRKFGWKLNWKTFRRFLSEKYGVTKALMFIGYVPEFEDMYTQLHESGFAIVLKPTFDMTRPRPEEPKIKSEKGKPDEAARPTKGNIDAELVLWAVKEMPNYDKAIVVSGDGDFYCLVEYLDEQNKLLKVLTPNSHYSGLYNKYQQYVEDLGKYSRELAHIDKRKASTKKQTK